ncbi:unnamed protein product [Calypogeia fissa]
MMMARSLSSRVGIQLVLLLTLCISNSFTFEVVVTDDDSLDPPSSSGSTGTSRVSISPRKKVQYTRTEEVKQKCPLLTPRPTQPDQRGGYGPGQYPLKQRLSFQYGDWEEEGSGGSTPIVPFLQWNESALSGKTKLTSFLITDVTADIQMLKGTMQLIIVDGNAPLEIPPYSPEASFRMDKGVSALTIELEGIFQQTENEDVVCMLGCTFLPSPDGGVHFPNIQNSGGTKTLEKNCDILVQLNYPIAFNLTSQIIRGTMQSLVPTGERYHFAPITFSSQLQIRGRYYEATPKEFINKACPAAADPSSEIDSNVYAYKAPMDDFCVLFSGNLRDMLLDVEPNWMCNGTTQNCKTVGPFANYTESTAYLADYNMGRARLFVSHILIHPCSYVNEGAGDEVPLSFVLRLVPFSESYLIARRHSGLDGHTLVAEGYWTNRSSTLCMIACQVDDATGQTDNCNFRVTLHIPLSLSITQRSLFKGSISSLLDDNQAGSFFPLSFHAELNLNERNLPYGYLSALRYNYSMMAMDLAGALLDRFEPETRLKTPWFKYPSLIGEEVGHYHSLADDLTIYGLKIREQKSSEGQNVWNTVNFDLVAVDKFLPFLYSVFMQVREEAAALNMSDTIVTQTDPRPNRLQETRKYLNCSGTLEFLGEYVDNNMKRLTISTEGLYNPLNGKMYMVGCRTIHASWQQIDENSFDLVDGMDCEIEVVLQYPTTFAMWLLNPGVKVKVHSNRPVSDIFHFEDIDTETYPILYKGQREQLVSRKSFEGALSVLTLSITLVCIISQLIYIGNHEQSTPYISLSMLAAQALGYAIPLITSAESLLARKFDYREEYFFRESGSVQMIIYVDKILTLVALLIFLRLFEKVWRERRSLCDLGDAGNVPRERKVLMICFIIHAVGFISVMLLHTQHSRPRVEDMYPAPAMGNDIYVGNETQTWPLGASVDWIRKGPLWQVLQEYTGLIEDLFLLPQVVGYGLWDVTGKPLRKFFFVGLTFFQIVPHVYDYIRSARLGSFGSPMYANPEFDFYTNVGNILIPALALIFALLVYCQQRWKGFLRLPRRFLYQPLGTKRGETELVSTNGRNHLPPIPEDEE